MENEKKQNGKLRMGRRLCEKKARALSVDENTEIVGERSQKLCGKRDGLSQMGSTGESSRMLCGQKDMLGVGEQGRKLCGMSPRYRLQHECSDSLMAKGLRGTFEEGRQSKGHRIERLQKNLHFWRMRTTEIKRNIHSPSHDQWERNLDRV